MTFPSRVQHLLCLALAAAAVSWPADASAQGLQSLFRKKADREVEGILEEKSGAAKWDLNPEILKPDSRSRNNDPGDPDHPQKPEDDPTSAELMRRVDGKRGPLSWASQGTPSPVECGAWKQFLPTDASGNVVLNLNNAVSMALLHSRSMQRAREELYLGALDVTEQRFRFSGRPSFLHDSNRIATGKDRPGGNVQTYRSDSTLGVTEHLATGADFVLSLANSMLFDLTKSGVNPSVSSLLNLSLVQPLLKYQAREYILENLTQSERTLLANVRRMKQYQQAFYIDVISGRNVSNTGPVRASAGATTAPIIAGSPSGTTTSGFLGLLQTRQQIRNQEASVAALRDSLAQLQAAFDAGRISNRLQVDQAQQALFSGQRSLLTARASYESAVDTYKVNLGLPPDLKVVVDDRFLEQFKLVDPEVSQLQSEVADVLDGLRRKANGGTTVESLKEQSVKAGAFGPRIQVQIQRARGDLESLRRKLPMRQQQLGKLRKFTEIQSLEKGESGGIPLEEVDDKLEANLQEVEKHALEVMKSLHALAGVDPPKDALERARTSVVTLVTELSSAVMQLSLIQAAARLETITLNPVDIDFDSALRLARTNRLDWMNARGWLVDSWRKVAVDAESLKTGLNLIVKGEVPTVGNRAENFSRDTARYQFGFELNLPWRRVVERNNYRETLIGYQRSRRDFILFEDSVRQSLRNSLRIVELNQINFEVRRATLRVAVAEVDLARLRLGEPPRPGGTATQFGATTARDLISALTDLLNAQNDFLLGWVSFEVLRVLLDYELGTMMLDEKGIWEDPGLITAPHLESRVKAEEAKDSGKIGAPIAVVSRAPIGRAPEGGTSQGVGVKKPVLGIYNKY